MMKPNTVFRLAAGAAIAAGAAGVIQCGGSSSSPSPATTSVATTTVATTTSTTTTPATTTTVPTTTSIAPIHADFVVTNSPAGVSPGQCSASQISGTSTQRIDCTFDGSSSTPANAITEYRWTLPGASDMFGVRLTNAVIPCGGFAAAGTEKPVTLRVTAPGGNDSTTKQVTFIKGAPC